jgi:Uma2 family endonuclease
MELALPPDPTTLDRPMTVEEWLQLPDGPPYPELIDGELVVNPSPLTDHQVVIGNLYVLLRAACPPELQVMLGPYGWAIDRYNAVEPDLLVTRREDMGRHVLETTPLLCIEVLSPSDRRHDLIRKRLAYERAGVPSYWIVDPIISPLTVRVLELVQDTYVEQERPGGNEAPFTGQRPFPVTIEPARLLD